MRNNPEVSDPAVDAGAARIINYSPSVLSCIGKRTKEGCDCGRGRLDSTHGQGGGRTTSSDETKRIWQKR